MSAWHLDPAITSQFEIEPIPRKLREILCTMDVVSELSPYGEFMIDNENNTEILVQQALDGDDKSLARLFGKYRKRPAENDLSEDGSSFAGAG